MKMEVVFMYKYVDCKCNGLESFERFEVISICLSNEDWYGFLFFFCNI